ncbi:MAG: type II secretion system minor pseudopilin GspK [Gallionella sp.]|nr:type II secretion system minor pseudopilin GspK [Gallionella sp.]
MRMRPAPLRRQQGVAVITALLLTTLAITIVTSLFWEQQVQVRSIENQRMQLQSEWIMRGALDWAALILREDTKYSSVDNLDEPWAIPLAETRLDQYVDNGLEDADIADAALSGGVSDAQARYNLANLCPGGTIDTVEVAAFERLLGNAQMDPALAQATAEVMAASLKKPEATAANSGGQAVPQPVNLMQVDDLLAVPGFTPEMLDRLKGFVIFLPRATPVNVNTAPAEVLAARISTLSLSDAAALVANRKTASYRDIADFSLRLQGKPLSVPANKLSVMTNYFLVNGKVRMSRARLETQALIERNGASTRLVWIREH